MAAKDQNTAGYVRGLAASHGITASLDRIDRMAYALTRLSGDEVVLDEIEILLVHLAREDIITQDELFALVEKYLYESKPT